MVDARKFIAVVSALAAVALLVWPPGDFTPEMSRAAALSVFALGLFAGGVFPEHVSAVLYFLIAMLFAVAPASVVFSGFHSTALWLVFWRPHHQCCGKRNRPRGPACKFDCGTASCLISDDCRRHGGHGHAHHDSHSVGHGQGDCVFAAGHGHCRPVRLRCWDAGTNGCPSRFRILRHISWFHDPSGKRSQRRPHGRHRGPVRHVPVLCGVHDASLPSAGLP